MLLDIYRYNPGWVVAAAEDSVRAKDFIDEASTRNGWAPRTVHADRGTSMTSKPVSAFACRPRRHPHPLETAGDERQPLFRGAVQDTEIPARLPRLLDSLVQAREFLDARPA